MQLKIKIDMDNAAFEGNPAIEAARILSELVEAMRDEHSETLSCAGCSEPLRDVNGNTVGQAKVTR